MASEKFPFEIKKADEMEKFEKYYNGYSEGKVVVGPKKYFFEKGYEKYAEEIYNMPVRSDDTFVVSYPRSGTTLAQELVWLIRNDLDFEKAQSIPLTDRYPFLELIMFCNAVTLKSIAQEADEKKKQALVYTATPSTEVLAKTPAPRFIKSHLPISLLPAKTLDTAKLCSPKPTSVQMLYLPPGIAPPDVRRTVASSIERAKLDTNPRHPMYNYLPIPRMLKSRNSLYNCVKPTNTKASLAKRELWRNSASLPSPFVPIQEKLPPGHDLHRPVVYVARDPHDVVVSYYHFQLSNLSLKYEGDFKAFFDQFIADCVYWSPFLEHVKEGWELRGHPNVLFLFYEDLVNDMAGCMRRVAEFFDKQYTDEQFAALAQHLYIDNFKANASVDLQVFRDAGTFAGEFVRKGKSKGWPDYFDEQLKARMDKWMEEGLRGSTLRFPTQ